VELVPGSDSPMVDRLCMAADNAVPGPATQLVRVLDIGGSSRYLDSMVSVSGSIDSGLRSVDSNKILVLDHLVVEEFVSARG